MTCAGCGRSVKLVETTVPGVGRCPACDALQGRCYVGASYSLVAPRWADRETQDVVYYDLEVLGSRGVERRHGWAARDQRDPLLGGMLIVQVG